MMAVYPFIDLYQLEVCPFLGFISSDKDAPSKHKVNTHTDCDSNHSAAQPQAEQYRKEQTSSNRQENRNQHGKFYIASRPESTSQRTGEWVGKSIENVVDEDKPDHQ